jgi:hypothetical protein
MPVTRGEGCVGRELELFHKGQLHSGKGGKVVSDPKQAKAIALSACGESRYGEMLSSIGFSEEAASFVVEMFAESFLKKATSSATSSSFEESDWQKSFETGKRPAKENPENYHTGEVYAKSPTAAKMAKTGVKGDNGWKQKDVEPEMLSGPALPKGPGNPQSGSSKEVYGMRALG